MEGENERLKGIIEKHELEIGEKNKLLKEKGEEISRLKGRLNEFEKEQSRMSSEIENIKEGNLKWREEMKRMREMIWSGSWNRSC